MDVHKAKTQVLPLIELGKRYFTPAQANKALILVHRIVADVLDGYQQVLDRQELLEVHQQRGNADEVRATQKTIIALVERLQSFSDELVDLGGEMKDWPTGIVDFPAYVDGREIQLCWRYGDETVCHWHEIDDGCSGRRSIDTLPVGV